RINPNNFSFFDSDGFRHLFLSNFIRDAYDFLPQGMLMELSSVKKKTADFQKAAASIKGKKMGPRDNTLI
ncbi:hypothetical protein LEMLEM_LOCUS16623, partial [Lemmus lemmus]